MLTTKLTLHPGWRFPLIGDDARVEAADPLPRFGGMVTTPTLISTRQDPIASEVYRQKIGTVEVADNRLDNGAREMRAFPINEYSGGGDS